VVHEINGPRPEINPSDDVSTVDTTFVLTVRAPSGPAGIRALRSALKVLWRQFRLKCLAVEER
jgi:hypothetical protein